MLEFPRKLKKEDFVDTINRTNLRDIATLAVKNRKIARQYKTVEDERWANRLKDRDDQMAQDSANLIINAIPGKINEAARFAKETRRGILIVAKIFIVREIMTSSTDTRGHLQKLDPAILKLVEKMIRSTKVDGVDSLRIITETEQLQYVSDGGAKSVLGPCKTYYIEAKVLLPK